MLVLEKQLFKIERVMKYNFTKIIILISQVKSFWSDK